MNGRIIWVIVTFSLLGMLSEGCGKKGPPVAPDVDFPPPVSDLLLERQKEQVFLTWSIPEAFRPENRGSWSAVVYRAAIPVSQMPCEDCPLMFVKSAALPISSSVSRNGQMKYEEGIKEGFIYWYKVVLVSSDGISTGDSNLVRVKGSSQGQ